MKIQKIIIHNFRSIKEQEISFDDYSILLGENNAGKTNIARALRIFYEKDLSFDDKVDFPKFDTDDKESWIEIAYLTTDIEQENLKDEYKSNDKILKVRKFLKSEISKKVKARQANIFAYENGKLSENLFYGAINISKSKIGDLIYIPELSKIDESVKMGGPSPLRNMLNFVVAKIATKSTSFAKLRDSFAEFDETFKNDVVEEFSIKNIEAGINAEIKDWNIKFGLQVNPLKPSEIVKNLVSHYVEDGHLNNQEVEINSFGQGLQRHLIFALIKLSAKYNDKLSAEEKNTKEFSPNFTLILFEEPEAFLHPSQQEKMNSSLSSLAEENDQQIVITTHSPIFVSKNIEKLSSLIKVTRDVESKIFQISSERVENLFIENNEMFQHFLKMLHDTNVDNDTKNKIRSKNFANENDDSKIRILEESFKYFLWLDGERASAFFAKHVLICEGATEKIFFDYLLGTEWEDLKGNGFYILDALGKFNIHRYMNLFGELGIKHSVLMDKDDDKDMHEEVNKFILARKNAYTKVIESFDHNLEKFLEVSSTTKKYKKPLNLLSQYNQGKIDGVKLKELKTLFKRLM